MTNQWTESAIDKYYQSIINKIQGGSLFGQPIDMNNQKQLVISAYLVAQTEDRNSNKTSTDLLIDLIRAQKPHSVPEWMLME